MTDLNETHGWLSHAVVFQDADGGRAHVDAAFSNEYDAQRFIEAMPATMQYSIRRLRDGENRWSDAVGELRVVADESDD